jgi:hypothetical protein
MKTTICKIPSASSITAATSSARPLYRAYDKLKHQRDQELNILWHKAQLAERAEKNTFQFFLNEILSPFDITLEFSTNWLTGHVNNLPITFCSGIRQREIFSFNYVEKKLQIRNMKEGDCQKIIKFTREVTPERLAKYILKYAFRQLQAVGKIGKKS